jgi:hypothetical protein
MGAPRAVAHRLGYGADQTRISSLVMAWCGVRRTRDLRVSVADDGM